MVRPREFSLLSLLLLLLTCTSSPKHRGVPCTCPFNAATYTIPPPGVAIKLHNPNLSWLTDVCSSSFS